MLRRPPCKQTCYARSGHEWTTYLVVEKVIREVESEGEEREELAPEAYCCVAAGGWAQYGLASCSRALRGK